MASHGGKICPPNKLPTQPPDSYKLARNTQKKELTLPPKQEETRRARAVSKSLQKHLTYGIGERGEEPGVLSGARKEGGAHKQRGPRGQLREKSRDRRTGVNGSKTGAALGKVPSGKKERV